MSEEMTLQWWNIDAVSLAPNPRKPETISAEKISEMAQSIMEHRITVPLAARMVDGKPQIYEGQRRYLGSLKALEMLKANGGAKSVMNEVTRLPLLVRDIDDRTMLEHQWVANLQREDVALSDEAEGYVEMRDKLGYSVTEIAQKIGKSHAYVSETMRLVGLPAAVWQALSEEKIGRKQLEMIAQVKHPEDRKDFIRRMMSGGDGGKPMTKQQTIALKAEFVVSLVGCGFDKSDQSLVALEMLGEMRLHGGACGGCEHLIGTARAPSCSNPTCYKMKQDAKWKIEANNAAETGRRVMNKDQTADLFDPVDLRVRPRSGLVDLGEMPRYDETGHYNEEMTPTWEALHEGTEARDLAIMARHPMTSRVHYLLEREKAIELAIESDPNNEAVFAQRPQKAKPAKAREEKEVVYASPSDEGEEEAESEGTDVAVDETKTKTKAMSSNDELEAKLAQMIAQWPEGGLVDKLFSVLYLSRLQALPVTALRLLYAVGGVGQAETIEWSKDGLLRLLLKSAELVGDEQRLSLMMECELAWAMVRDDETVMPLVRQMCPAVATPETEPEPEKLYECVFCEGQNFTKKGLAVHNCKKRQGKKQAAEAAAVQSAADELAALKYAKDTLKKPKQSEGKEAYNAWSAERMRINRALKKLGH